MQVEYWTLEHPRWEDLAAMAASVNETRVLTVLFDWHIESHIFVALADDAVVGYLRYCTQPIGPDNDCPALTLDGVELIEGKVMGFYVLEAWRRMGFGRSLQQAALTHAKSIGYYQLRSRSSAEKTANHQLKLNMGFSAVPTIRSGGRQGVYFLMPLQTERLESGNDAHFKEMATTK